MMERELLGFEREDDCPSAEVPARYFHFQRSGDPTHILPVLRHNAWDILSLVALAAHLAAVVDGRTAPLQEARATTYEGDFGAATLAWEKTLASPSISRGDRLEALQQLARCSARLGEWVRAAECWQGIAEDPRLRRVSAFVELAKIQEHKSKDVWRALASVDEALSLLDRGLLRPGPAASESCREALVRRQQRLAGFYYYECRRRTPRAASFNETRFFLRCNLDSAMSSCRYWKSLSFFTRASCSASTDGSTSFKLPRGE